MGKITGNRGGERVDWKELPERVRLSYKLLQIRSRAATSDEGRPKGAQLVAGLASVAALLARSEQASYPRGGSPARSVPPFA